MLKIEHRDTKAQTCGDNAVLKSQSVLTQRHEDTVV